MQGKGRQGRIDAFRARGYTLIGLLLALTVAAAALPMAHQMMNRDSQNTAAQAAGNELAQLSVGLRGYIADIQAGNEPPAAGPVDLDLFRPEACGGPPRGHMNATEGYIPCHIARYGAADTIFGTNYAIEVDNFGADGWEVRAHFPVDTADPARRGVIASRVINAAAAHTGQPANGLFQNFLANVPVGSIDPDDATTDPTDPNFGRVLLIASNRPSGDLWLRRDGSNKMEANVRAGGNSLVDADSIDASGDLVLGNDAYIGGDTVIQQNLAAGENINAGANIRAGRSVFASEDVVALGDVVAGDKVVAENDVVAGERFLGRDVYLEDIDAFASQGVYMQTVVDGNGDFVPEPQCPDGMTPLVFTSVQSMAGNVGQPMHGLRARPVPAAGGWEIYAELLDPDGNWTGMVDANVVVGTKCGG